MKRKRGRAKGKLSSNLKSDLIIAKVVEVFSMWGISGNQAYPIISKAAYEVLERLSEYDEGGLLSVSQIKKIHLAYKKRKRKEESWDWSFEIMGFQSRLYTKESLNEHRPSVNSLEQIASDLMEFMNATPMRCIFKPDDSLEADSSVPIVQEFFKSYHGQIQKVLGERSLLFAKKHQMYIDSMPKIKTDSYVDEYGNVIPFGMDMKTHQWMMGVKGLALLHMIKILKFYLSTLK